MAKSTFLRGFAKDWLKPLTFWALALPGLWLAWQWGLLLNGAPNDLGFNPIEKTHRFLGDTALRILRPSGMPPRIWPPISVSTSISLPA